MTRRVIRGQKWEYPSLEWIHRVRRGIYEKQGRKPLTELPRGLSPEIAAMARRLGLKILRAERLPARRKRSA